MCIPLWLHTLSKISAVFKPRPNFNQRRERWAEACGGLINHFPCHHLGGNWQRICKTGKRIGRSKLLGSYSQVWKEMAKNLTSSPFQSLGEINTLWQNRMRAYLFFYALGTEMINLWKCVSAVMRQGSPFSSWGREPARWWKGPETQAQTNSSKAHSIQKPLESVDEERNW